MLVKNLKIYPSHQKQSWLNREIINKPNCTFLPAQLSECDSHPACPKLRQSTWMYTSKQNCLSLMEDSRDTQIHSLFKCYLVTGASKFNFWAIIRDGFLCKCCNLIINWHINMLRNCVNLDVSVVGLKTYGSQKDLH